LLWAGASANHANRYGTTALMWASQQGSLGCVKVLLRYRADVNQASKDGNTPLLWACRAGHVDIAKLLLLKQAKVNQSNSDGETPLMAACSTGQVQIVKLLLRARCEISRTNQFRQTACDIAKNWNFDEIVQIFQEQVHNIEKEQVNAKREERLYYKSLTKQQRRHYRRAMATKPAPQLTALQ